MWAGFDPRSRWKQTLAFGPNSERWYTCTNPHKVRRVLPLEMSDWRWLMNLQRVLKHKIGDFMRNTPSVRSGLIAIEDGLECARHSAANVFPALIRPRPKKVMIAITGSCNARCLGCRYERDFMVGEQLSYQTVEGPQSSEALRTYSWNSQQKKSCSGLGGGRRRSASACLCK